MKRGVNVLSRAGSKGKSKSGFYVLTRDRGHTSPIAG